MKQYLQLVATGPELSKSLDAGQAEDAISMILDGEIDPVRSGIFLIALRMKRETEAENRGAMSALTARVRHVKARVPEVLAIADPFNGYSRGLPATPFLPALFAACGLPCYCHGLLEAGPKYGITLHQVLELAGKPVNLTVQQAAERLEDGDAGWSYLDQASYIPELHQLVGLRDTMVKRTCISTLEVVLKPVSGTARTHLMTGFVHKAYPPVYAMLARQAGFDSAMIIRGVEGGSIPSLSQVSRYFGAYGDGEAKLHRLSPAEIGIHQDERAVLVPGDLQQLSESAGYGETHALLPLVEKTVTLGLDALAGKPGPMHDSLVYGAAIGLCHAGVCGSLQQGASLARSKLANGEALQRFHPG